MEINKSDKDNHEKLTKRYVRTDKCENSIFAIIADLVTGQEMDVIPYFCPRVFFPVFRIQVLVKLGPWILTQKGPNPTPKKGK
jgi:hypothetical protein